jgi:phage shock protein C
VSDGDRRPGRPDLARVMGIGLVALGVLFLARQFMPAWFDVWWGFATRAAWPLAIIVLGAVLIMSAGRRLDVRGPIPGSRLYRSRNDRWISGVLGGLGSYLGMDAVLLRLAFVAISLVAGFWPGIIAYVVMAFVVPQEPAEAGGPPVAGA